jgi:hypothetical protein
MESGLAPIAIRADPARREPAQSPHFALAAASHGRASDGKTGAPSRL